MSYDVWITVPDPWHEDGERVVLDVGNYTRNVSPMWAHALGGTTLGDLIERTPRCGDIATPLHAAANVMANLPDVYRAMNPENGWGDYEGARDYLRDIARACTVMAPHPHAKVRVSR